MARTVNEAMPCTDKPITCHQDDVVLTIPSSWETTNRDDMMWLWISQKKTNPPRTVIRRLEDAPLSSDRDLEANDDPLLVPDIFLSRWWKDPSTRPCSCLSPPPPSQEKSRTTLLLTQRSLKPLSSKDNHDYARDLSPTSVITKNDYASDAFHSQEESSSLLCMDDQHLLESKNDYYKKMQYRRELLKDDLSMFESQLSRSFQKGRRIARPLRRRRGNHVSSLPIAY